MFDVLQHGIRVEEVLVVFDGNGSQIVGHRTFQQSLFDFADAVFETIIPRDVQISESPSHGLSVLDYAPRARGARAYAELVLEVIDRE